jgi:hypothetical protein
MKVTKQCTWKRDRCVMVRLNQAVYDEIVLGAAESRHTVAEMVANMLADFALRRTTERNHAEKLT